MTDIDLKTALRGEPGPGLVRVVSGLGVAVFGLWLLALIGYFAVKHDTTTLASGDSSSVTRGASSPGDEQIQVDPETGQPILIDPATGQPIPGAGPAGGGGGGGFGGTGTSSSGGPGGTSAAGPGTTKPGGSGGGSSQPSTAGDRTGVSAKEIKWALHAPVTFDGAPVGLADNALKGVDTYLKIVNEQGGINGRTIVYKVYDDRYTVAGATTSSKEAINDYKPFFVSGTLGVDQVAVYALEAKKRGVPYIAGGGSEKAFKDIGMFQVSTSYDTHLIQLADFLAKESKTNGSPYFGRTKVGVISLDSEYIKPSVDAFGAELRAKGMTLAKVVTVRKPTEQTTYSGEIQELSGAGAQIVVPAMDPISTSRVTQECSPSSNNNPTPPCSWKWSFSNFAHESDTALLLMRGTWTGVRGLAGGCYYQAPTRDDPSKCAKLGVAHTQWVQKNSESDWVEKGSGGAAGYQIVHLWLKALKDAGTDPTRERFRAALLTYSGYDDLVSSPITYRGSANLSHGSEKMTVLEAGSNNKYSQITPGFVDGF